MDRLKCDLKSLSKEVSMEGDDECGSRVKKNEFSGGNISLVVDFSGTGISSDNVIKSDGSCLNENLVKGNGYREEDDTQELLVGNLVWVMTKYKKWWPGEVVDFKADAKMSFMVRYIGQSHLVSWFAPSKMKPFRESFETVLNQRSEQSFFSAVEKAMTLLGNSLKLDMTCSCIAEGNGSISAKNGTTWKNKPLILRELSVEQWKPKEFVTKLKNIASCVSNANILEMTVMQSQLSAFYSFFGHKQIPMGQLHENEVRKSFTAKMNGGQFIGFPSIVAGNSRKRFRKEWFRRFISEVDNVFARDDIVNVPPSDMLSKLKLLAVDYKCSEETENIGLLIWFFSKFRISEFHDEKAYKKQLNKMAGFKDLMFAKDETPCTEQKIAKSKKSRKSKIELLSGVLVAGTEQKTFESQNSEKLKLKSLNGVSTPDNEHEASKSKKSGKTKIKHIIGHLDFSNSVPNALFAKDFQEKLLIQSPNGKATTADTLSRPAAILVPDLNTGSNALGTAESERLKRSETLIAPKVCSQEEMTPRSMMFNFQVTAPCSTSGVSGTQFVSSQPASVRFFTSADLFPKKKRGRKRKNPEEFAIVLHATSGIPDLNGMTTEPSSVLPQVEPTQRRRRRKKEDSPNGITRGITVLFLKFSSQVSMPSRDDLTSKFSAFGPLDSLETHVSEEFSSAQVAFVSSGDAIEAVKSLEKANPFGENLVSFRLQQKVITVRRSIAPQMPVISHFSPVLKLNNTPSVPKLNSTPPVPKLNCTPPVPKLNSTPPVPKLKSTPPVPKLNSTPPVPKLNNTPTSVDSMKQNLMMMTSMLEKSGDRLSREMKAKLKSEISGLLEKLSSVSSSSSSSCVPCVVTYVPQSMS